MRMRRKVDRLPAAGPHSLVPVVLGTGSLGKGAGGMPCGRQIIGIARSPTKEERCNAMNVLAAGEADTHAQRPRARNALAKGRHK